MYQPYNPNPHGARVGDCVIRAICKAISSDWDSTYMGVCVEGLIHGDMPSSNAVWGAYLRRRGFRRRAMPDTCPDCYTVADFCADHPKGVYILAISGHVVCAMDGDYFDTWDSGDEIPAFYWEKEA